MHLVFLLHFW